MSAATHRAKGSRYRCAPGRVRVGATIDDTAFERIKALAVANKLSISAQIEALLEKSLGEAE